MPHTGDRTAQAARRSGARHSNNDGLIPVLARRVREVEAKAQAGKKLLAAEAGLLHEEVDLLGRQHLGEVRRRDRPVLAGADP